MQLVLFVRDPISVYLSIKKPPKSRYLSRVAGETRHKICHRKGTRPWGQMGEIESAG